MKTSFKSLLHNACLTEIKNRVDVVLNSLERLQDSKKNETKSSAGDKYETGRAMIQQEEAQLQKQLGVAQRIQAEMKLLDPLKGSTEIEHGSLIITNKGTFYLSSSLGKIEVDNKEVYCLSCASPIGRMFMNKQKGDVFSFNKIDYKIKLVS